MNFFKSLSLEIVLCQAHKISFYFKLLDDS